jgi:hypothetical protein
LIKAKAHVQRIFSAADMPLITHHQNFAFMKFYTNVNMFEMLKAKQQQIHGTG